MMVTGPGEQGAAVAKMVASSNPLEGDDVPKPGEGPSKESREAGHYDVLFVGTNANGDRYGSHRYRRHGPRLRLNF